MSQQKEIRCGIIGYGGACDMGNVHIASLEKHAGMRATAVCDIDPARTALAKSQHPGIEVYNDANEMLAKAPVDLAVVITPHNTHAPLALQALEAGKHCIVEKPMCISIEEADAMIAAARRSGKMLSAAHNRRWEANYLAMREIIERGIIGEVFHVEAYTGGFGHPGHSWRSDKKASGGAFYDWGAHYVFWMLGLIPEPIESVSGFFHDRVWNDCTNEDQVQAIIRFKSGAVGDIQISSIAYAGKAQWRILGTRGAIVDEGDRGAFKVFAGHEGYPAQFEVKYPITGTKEFMAMFAEYYGNIADHLLRGAPLEITPEAARRVIAVMDLAERSAKTGQPEKMPES